MFEDSDRRQPTELDALAPSRARLLHPGVEDPKSESQSALVPKAPSAIQPPKHRLLTGPQASSDLDLGGVQEIRVTASEQKSAEQDDRDYGQAHGDRKDQFLASQGS